MALTQVRTALAFNASGILTPAQIYIETTPVDVTTLSTAGVAIGLNLQVYTTAVANTATNTTDLIEVLTSQDGTTYDTPTQTGYVANPYASYTLTFTASVTNQEAVTIPIAYPEGIHYLKVRISCGAGASSSHTYAAALLKTTA
jgi:hypothetical protein